MSGIDASEYSLFNTGNDAPWPDDYIEFVQNDSVVIHRGSAVGFYRYKYDGILVNRDVDAEDLIDMGLAKKISLDICEPWQDSYIEFNGDKLVLRNFLAPSRGKKNYIIFEEGKFFVVNKYYLLANAYASVCDDKIYEDVDLPKIDYNAPTSPWKEDGIRFVTDKVIEKSTKPGMYVEKRGSITSVRSLTAILGMGYAVRECDAKKHFFSQYCQDEKTKREYKGETLTKDFVEAFFTEDSPIIVHENFKVENLFDLMICYHCAKQSVIPFGKESEMHIESISPSVIEEYRNAIEQCKKLITRAIAVNVKVVDLKKQANAIISKMINSIYAYHTSTDYLYWKSSLAKAAQMDYTLFYSRIVVNDPKWESLLNRTAAIRNEFIQHENEMNKIKTQLNEQNTVINSLKSGISMPTSKGRKKDVAELAELKEKADSDVGKLSTDYLNASQYVQNEIVSQKNTFNAFANCVEEDKAHMDRRLAKFNEVKAYVEANAGQTAKGLLVSLFNKELKPWDKNLKFTRKDYLIERFEGDSYLTDGLNKKVKQCYKVTYKPGVSEILFPAALIYVGLAKSK